jgi:ketosteroid isomerase-like protein
VIARDEELIREVIDAWNRGDLDAMLARMDPNVEIRLSGLFPGLDQRPRGHAGFTAFWHEFRAAWSNLAIEIDEVRPQGGRVFAATTFRGLGREGVQVERPFFFAFFLRDGLVVRYLSSGDRAEALDVLGFSRT